MSVEELYTSEPPARPVDGPALRIYSNPICPFAQRTRIIAAHLKVPHEIVNIHLQRKPAWFLSEINPRGQVPVVDHNGRIIRESAIAFDYIDDVFNGGKLWQSDPYTKAQARLLFDGFSNKFIPNYYKHYRGTATDETNTELVKFIEIMEESITSYGGRFLFGDVSAVDFLTWPWLERLVPALVVFPDLAAVVSKDKQPVLFSYIERMKQLEAIQQTMISVEGHLAFFKSIKDGGSHDYSAGDTDGKGVKIHASKPQ